MTFSAFLEDYQERQLSIHRHAMRRGDIPLFLE